MGTALNPDLQSKGNNNTGSAPISSMKSQELGFKLAAD